MAIELMNGYNTDLHKQIKALNKILMSSPLMNKTLSRAESLGLEDYYIGAGCVVQTVWNYLSQRSLDYGICDIDFVYFDPQDLGEEAEDRVGSMVSELYGDLGIKVDVVNQARVHLWYESHFGFSIKPYTSLEAAINSWPTTATAIGVRKDPNSQLRVYAPFGLNDLFGKVVRANKAQITKEIYEKKAAKWLSKWPDLNIIPWEG